MCATREVLKSWFRIVFQICAFITLEHEASQISSCIRTRIDIDAVGINFWLKNRCEDRDIGHNFGCGKS